MACIEGNRRVKQTWDESLMQPSSGLDSLHAVKQRRDEFLNPPLSASHFYKLWAYN